MILTIKNFLLKLCLYSVVASDNNLDTLSRATSFAKVFLFLAPLSVLLESFNLWFNNNQEFATGAVLLITINMVIGAITHKRLGNFRWKFFMLKTIETIGVTSITYLVIQIILNVAGENYITNIFETILQVSTLLYPGGKILKNVFLLSDGKHPPKWIMQKIYDFQESGDLSKFLSTPKDKDEE